MKARQSAKALEMAIRQRLYPMNTLLHHSDRGLQFCSDEFVSLATKNNISMSMTEQYDPYENALAERMNKTIKDEFIFDSTLKSLDHVFELINESVFLYNNYRPHQALNWNTPEFVHKNPRYGATRDLF